MLLIVIRGVDDGFDDDSIMFDFLRETYMRT